MHLSRHHLNCIPRLIFLSCVCLVACHGAVVSTALPQALLCTEGCEEQDGVLTCGNTWPTVSARNLKICNWSNETLDPRGLIPAQHELRNLSIHAGAHDEDLERRFSHVFPEGLTLEVLNISRLGLGSLEPAGLLDALAATLRELDVSYNRLITLSPATLLPLNNLETALFTGNLWSCSVELTWLLDTPLAPKLTDLTRWTCGPELYPGKPFLPVLSMLRALRSQCPSRPPHNCSCELSNVVWGGAGMGQAPSSPTPLFDERDDLHGEFLIPVIVVNCSARGLYRMPHYLPANTTTLILTKNMISDVRPLSNNTHYRRVLDVILDHNQVRSIAALEGSEWLSAFRVLNLRGNQLSQLPTYALDHAFQKNRNFAQLYLGNNPWNCDCMFTPGFQGLLAKYQSVVRDISDIRCATREGDDNSQQPIRDLSRSMLCQEPRGALTGLDLLNAALAILIVLVLGKLAYDYWAFKTSGRLPWLVAKMP